MAKQYKNLTSKIILFASIFIIAKTVTATKTDTDELVALLSNTHTMQATFEQFLISQKGVKIGQKTTGSMALKRPGKFRWETTQPIKQLIIITGNRSLLYDADLAQVVKRKMDQNISGNPAMLLSNTTETLPKSFKITKLQKSGTSLWFELTPKIRNTQENGYQRIRVHFSNKQLTGMQIADNLGQKTIINFSNVRLNLPIPAKIFVFNPPSNTEIFYTN